MNLDPQDLDALNAIAQDPVNLYECPSEDYYPEFDDMWSYAPQNQIEPSPLFKKLEISRQASDNFSTSQGFLDGYFLGAWVIDLFPNWFFPSHDFGWLENSLDRFLKWLHLLKFLICLWLDIDKHPQHGRSPDFDGVAYDNYRSDSGGSDSPSWAASWDEYKVGIGLKNWFYTVEWESNW